MNDDLARRRRNMRLRVCLLASLLAAGGGAVLVKAWSLQVSRAGELREMAEDQYQRSVSLASKRGGIYDRSGAELAVSVDVDSVWANPQALRKAGAEPVLIANRLSELTGVDAGVLTERLSSDRQFVWIKRRVSSAQGKAVHAARLPGVAISQEARRYYPNLELGAHLLGFTSVDGDGIDGLEMMLDKDLRGPVRPVPALFDRRGAVVYSDQLLDPRAAQGNEVTLTLDKAIQHIAERELELAVRSSEAHSASLVAIDPSTGEVLAMANYPTFNPNEPSKAPSSARRNRALTDRFEPGSTVKPFTVAGALATGAISPTRQFDCENGAWRVDEHIIRDTHRWHKLTPAEILAQSSNIGTAKIGIELGRAGLHRALSRFGFGELPGVGLPGESSGVLSPYKRWYNMDAATIAFGQGMSTTALQLAMAMGALGNRGRLMEPQLVKRVTDPQGQLVRQSNPTLRRQVVPESVARLITDMLIGVTGEDGTGTEAAVEGHLVAGKTGTAQKADYQHGGYAKDKWTASFVGYAPAQKPKLVIAVVIDEPGVAHLGGMVAGPVFRRVMEPALRHLGVQADIHGTLSDQVRARKQEEARIAQALAPISPLAAAEAAREAQPVVPQGGRAIVPNLVGQSARSAITRARAQDFEVRLFGTGVVVEQEPEANSVSARGGLLRLHLRAPNAQQEVLLPAPAPQPTAAPTSPALPSPPKAELRAREPAKLPPPPALERLNG